MSLTKEKKPEQPAQPEPIARDALATRAEIEEELARERRAYQKEHRKRHLDQWNADKAELDGKNEEQLIEFMEQIKKERRDRETRVGLHSMKVNSYELAMIKLAMKKTGSRSSRELLVMICEQINNGSIELS